jgi:hypothetical protein
MKELGLDHKDYTYHSSDDKSTTLKHKKGHLITVAHAALSPKNRAILMAIIPKGDNRMAEGGKIPQEMPNIDSRTLMYDGGSSSDPSNYNTSSTLPSNYRGPEGTPSAWENIKNELGFGKTNPNQDLQDVIDKYKNMRDVKAEGGYVKEIHPDEKEPGYANNRENMAMGGDPANTPYEMGLPCLNPSCKSHGKPHPNCRCYSMAEGGKVYKGVHYCAHGKPHMPGCEYAKGGEVKGTSQQGRDVRYANKVKNSPHSSDLYSHDQAMDYAKSEAKGRAEFERQAVKPKMKGLASGGSIQRKMYADQDEPVDKDDSAPHSSSGFEDIPLEAAVKRVDSEIKARHGVPSSIAVDDQPDTTQDQAPVADNTEQPSQEDVAGGGGKLPEETVPDEFETEQSDAEQAAGVQNNAVPQSAPQQIAPASPITPQDYHAALRNHLATQDQEFQQDLNNGHITPLTYQHLMAYGPDGKENSTLGKIGTLFGLLLSGAGSGLAHQPNAMMEMMKQTIDNDMAAQEKSKFNAQNLLRLSQQQELNEANIAQLKQQGKLTAAEAENMQNEALLKGNALARIRANRIALHTMVDQATNLPANNPLRQQAEAALPLLYQSVNNENNDLADRAAAAATLQKYGVPQTQNQSPAQQDPEEAFKQRQKALFLSGNEKQAQYEAARHVPGIQGSASREIPEGTQQQLYAMNVLDSKGKDLLNFVHQHAGTWNPQTRAQAEQKLEEMKNFYNGSIEGGALTKGRLSWYDQQFGGKGSPTDILNQLLGNTKRFKEVVDSNALRKDLLLKNYGFTGGPSTNPISLTQPMSKTKKPIIFRNGRWEYK